jgi:hypothetical protein
MSTMTTRSIDAPTMQHGVPRITSARKTAVFVGLLFATGPSTTTLSWLRRWAAQPPSHWRISICMRMLKTGSPRCGRRGNGLFLPGTPNGVGSSAICTTAPNSVWSHLRLP